MGIISQMNSNNNIDFESVFMRFNDELIKTGKSLDLICAGGFVMQINGYRTTVDVDAFFKSNAEIDKIIRKVGNDFGINRVDELWLNNSISNMNPDPPMIYCKSVYDFSNLKVAAVDMDYLIGMKLSSAREQDIKDVASIIKREQKDQPFKLLHELKNMNFDTDISILLDSFGRAYGMDWLNEFFIKNEAELRKYY